MAYVTIFTEYSGLKEIFIDNRVLQQFILKMFCVNLQYEFPE